MVECSGPSGFAMKYRPAIDGLRSLAVLSVILYHYQMFHFRGGFLGVDIFFVISGYLISGLMLEEVAATGQVSFSKFWLRRARRILPALLFMLAGVSALAWVFFSGTSLLPAYAQSLLASLFSASNFLFYSQSGYFDAASITKPLLHTWSLAVEEQFYLLFPFIFHVLLVKAKASRPAVMTGLLGAILLSCGACFFLQGEKASAFAFFMLPTRLWELLAGTALAYAERERMLPELNKAAGHVLELAALGVILVCVLYAEKRLGFWNVLVVMGTVSLLHARSGYSASVFSFKPFVLIGKLSYSLYLWHWPFIVLLTLYVFKVQTWQKSILLALTFACAYGSYHYIEQPMRKVSIGWKQVASRLGPAAACLCALGLCAILIRQTPAFQIPEASDTASIKGVIKHVQYDRSGSLLSLEYVGDNDKELDFIALGDSHLASIRDTLLSLSVKNNARGGVIASTGLFFQPDFQYADEHEARARIPRAANDFIDQSGVKILLLAERWHSYMHGWSVLYKGERLRGKKRQEILRKGIKEHLQHWLDAGVTVFLLEQVPEHPYRSMEMAAFFTVSTPVDAMKAQDTFLQELVREMNHPNLHLLPTHAPFRKNDQYYFIKEGKLLYIDGNHLNYFGSEELTDVLQLFFEHIQKTRQTQAVSR